jgi:heptosyltransferase-2
MKILIVKLGAMGDVMRTTPLLTALKRLHPKASITWVVDESSVPALRGNPLIDSLMTYSPKTLEALKTETFDLAVNLDKEEEALDTIMLARATVKRGFGRDPKSGTLTPLDEQSRYAYRLGLDDDLKFRQNKKTYQEISFEQVGLAFTGEEYIFQISDANRDFAANHLKKLGAGPRGSGPCIGVNTGSGPRFAGKKLPLESYARLAEKIYRQTGSPAILLGGEAEIARNREIEALSSAPVINAGSQSLEKFASIVSLCDAVITGDTIAMHVAIAMKVPVVVFFASTCAAEIELYGRGQKVISPINCAPCYKRICPIDEQCMKELEVDALLLPALRLAKSSALS